MIHRHELTDEQWMRLAPLLPQPKRGPQPHDRRQVVNGLLWLLATGAPWRDLPERYGAWRTVASQFYRWVHAGCWEQVLATLQQQGDAQGRLDWSTHFVDGTVIRAHQHAAGARRAKGGPHSKHSGEAKGDFPPNCMCVSNAAASPLRSS